MTGYESYNAAEREAIIRDMQKNIEGERSAADGIGIRAEVARSNIRHFEKQIRNIRETAAILAADPGENMTFFDE